MIAYRPEVDGLRAIAVLFVVVFHAFPGLLPGGFVGVDIFFVISGYLITSLIWADLASERFSLSAFFQRRIARIFPALFVTASLTLAATSLVYSDQDFASAGAGYSASMLSVANMKFMLQGTYFTASRDAQPFLHYWSLSIEEQFYLLFPLFLACTFKLGRSVVGRVMLGATMASMLGCIIVTSIDSNIAFYLLPTRAWELGLGALVAISSAANSIRATAKGSLSWVGLAFVFLSPLLIAEGNQFPGWIALLPTLATCMLLKFSSSERNLVGQLLSTPALVGVGKRSYSLYLWHWPVFCLVDYAALTQSDPVRFATKVLLTIGLTLLCYEWIERPARKWLTDRSRKTLVLTSTAALILVSASFGVLIRNANFLDASADSIRSGGLSYPASNSQGTVILLGDSNASMYAKRVRDICEANQITLHVMSVSAGDTLPSQLGQVATLWPDAVNAIRRIQPDAVILSSHWSSKLKEDPMRLSVAVEELLAVSKRIVLFDQPAILPSNLSRDLVRHSGLGTYFEEPELARLRARTNGEVHRLAAPNVRVISVADKFIRQDGSIQYLDDHGRALFQDATHLSSFGTKQLERQLNEAVLWGATGRTALP